MREDTRNTTSRQDTPEEVRFRQALATLHEVTLQLSLAASADELCRRAVELGVGALGLGRIGVWFLDDSHEWILGTYGVDEHGALRDERGSRMPVTPEGVAIRILRREDQVVEEQDELFDDQHRGVGAGTRIIAGMWDGANVLGILCVDDLLAPGSLAGHRSELVRLYAQAIGHLHARLRAQQELREALLFNEEIIASVGCGIAVLDRDLRRIGWNPAMARLTGLSAEEALGRPALEGAVTEAREQMYALLRRALNGETTALPEARFHNPKAGVSWSDSATFAPHRNGNGEVIGVIVATTDVTELRESRDHYSALFERGIATWVEDFSEVAARFERLREAGVTDLGGYLDAHPEQLSEYAAAVKVIEVNEESLSFCGAATKEELITNLASYFPPEAWPVFRAELIALFDGRTRFQSEIPLITQDGRAKTADFSLSVVAGYEQNLGRVLVWFRDITDQWAADEQLRRMVEGAPDAIFIRVGERFAYLNARAVELFGAASAEELLGTPILDRCAPEFREAARGRIRALNESRRAVPPLERVYLRMDGSRIGVEASAVPFVYHGQDGALVFVRDITERLAERRARERDAELARGLLNALPCVALLLQEETREVVAANRAGIDGGALPGMTCYGARRREAPCPWCLAPELWRTGRPQSLEVEADGIVWDAHWEPLGDGIYLHYAFDITERRREERERLVLQRQLEQAQRLESIGVLAGGVAHDFNNILTAVVGFTELAQDEVGPDSRAREYLRQVLAGAARAKELVRQILTFSRQAPTARKPLLLPPLVEDSLRFIRASLPATVEIQHRLDPETPLVRADATQIHQVIVNLCTNAEHAMRPEGGVLTVTLAAIEVDIARAEQLGSIVPGKHAVLSVSDTGCGMDAATRERAFEPFFTTKPVGEGTGLGLATCYGIATSHGGAITVESEVGVGATFHIYLPAEESGAGETADEAGEAPKGTGAVLFVDDEPALATTGEAMLRSLGYEPTVCLGSREALDAFRADPSGFDLIMTDQAMPHTTGLGLIAEIRRANATIPVILMTGYSSMVTPEVQKELRIHTVLLKPYTKRQLAEAASQALGRS